MPTVDRDAVGSRVRVELADGYNCVGTVRRVYPDSRGRREILIEDTQGNERTVRPYRPSVDVVVLGDRDDTGRGGSA
jgi:hypothetical protein